jgi:hypothetical protein
MKEGTGMRRRARMKRTRRRRMKNCTIGSQRRSTTSMV